MKKVDLVFEGGGVKGLAYVGAIEVMEKMGYVPNSIAGTSAGAIIAALLAVGYKSEQISEIMWGMDFSKMQDESGLDKIPLIGKALSLFLEKGIYEGDYIEHWLSDLLLKAPRPAEHFKDLDSDLKIIAADLSTGKMLVLPDDIVDFGIEPGNLKIEYAVRMSISIPFFFEPVTLRNLKREKCYIVDGGILSNYPVHLFDCDGSHAPRWPTFGFRLKEPGEGSHHEINNPLQMFAAIFSTMLSARDKADANSSVEVRTIDIHTGNVKATDFDLSDDRKRILVESGKDAAEEFFQYWDFDNYIKEYRS